MPELPEVETVARGLRAVLPGRRISACASPTRRISSTIRRLSRVRLPGTRVRSVERSGKFLVIALDAPDALDGGLPSLSLLVHLGMTGRLVACPAEAPAPPHTHVYFELDDGRELRYTDPRRFGRMSLREDGAENPALSHFSQAGLDPLETTEAEFAAALGGRRARIKALLLDQRVLRGMGNIYADESLWRARIHPKHIGARLKAQELRRLYRVVQSVLREAIRFRGSSISDYVDAEGQRGWYQQRHRVYGREGKKCTRCCSGIRRETVAGRSSHFCPRCQR